MPPAALCDRFVFRKLLARYYPALARIPHAEEPAPIIPNLRWQLARFYHGLPRYALKKCIGETRTAALMLRMYRGTDFRTYSKLAAPQQRAHMLSTIAASRAAMHEVLGFDLSPDYQALVSDDLLALRSLFTVASYARRCVGAHQSTPSRTGSTQHAPSTAIAD
jgi:hypothetical protein